MNSNIETMGVINITPNSFSDGGSTYSLDSFLERWEDLQDQNVSILDIGAESTAPFNNPVSEKEEIERFEKILFPLLGTLKLPQVLSIDTYRPEVFKFVYREIKKNFSQQKFIWNDVSGILDEEVWEMLREFSDVDYVFGHTLNAERKNTSSHMDQSLVGDPVVVLESHFKSGLKEFSKRGLESRVIFDPLFGFSKTLEQNLLLIKELPSLVKKFGLERRWLLGISKKSFLQKQLPSTLSKKQTLSYTEYLHSIILSRWLHQMRGHKLIFRVHDPLVVSVSKLGASVIDNPL